MRKIELYLNSKNRPAIDVYRNINDSIESKQIRKTKALDAIDEISTCKIVDVSIKDEDIIVKYDGFVLNIREYQEVFKLNEMKQLKSIIAKHYNHQNQRKVKKKNVKRKNKHTGSKIIAAALVLSLIGTGAVAAYEKNDNYNYLAQSAYSEVEDTMSLEEITIKVPETTEVKVVETTTNNTENQTDVITLDYQDRSNTEKAKITVAYYGDKIKKYAEMYGLDPELMIAIATQERGVHRETMDPGGATGLMQIQNSVWRNQTLTAYNYQTQKNETIKVSEAELSNIDYNIKVGCMIFQTTLKYMNYNIVAAVQCYNMGYGNMETILTAYSRQTGKTINQILNDKTDIKWLEYRSLINQGDRDYAEHVFSFMPRGDELKVLNLDEEINVEITSIRK